MECNDISHEFEAILAVPLIVKVVESAAYPTLMAKINNTAKAINFCFV